MGDLLPQNLKKLQIQLLAAIRVHRNLVGKMNTDPLNGELLLKVRQAELLIERIFMEQKPLVERFHRDVSCCRNGSMKSPYQQRSLMSTDEVLEDNISRHFCPTTLEKLQPAVTKMSPDKKRKINFLALFDVMPHNIVEDIKEARNSKRKRKLLVNAEFPLPGNGLLEPSKRSKLNNGALVTSCLVGMNEGIRTRSSRRAKAASGNLNENATLKQGGSKKDGDKQSDTPNDKFCCALCQKVLQLQSTRVSGIVYWCANCKIMTTLPHASTVNLPRQDEPGSSNAEFQNQVLRAEAEHWQKSLMQLEAKKQRLMERNNCNEKHINCLVGQLTPKINGIKQHS